MQNCKVDSLFEIKKKLKLKVDVLFYISFSSVTEGVFKGRKNQFFKMTTLKFKLLIFQKADLKFFGAYRITVLNPLLCAKR